MAYTIGAIVRSDLWGRFFDFRPRGWWKTRERAAARRALARATRVRSCQPSSAESGDTAKLSERQRVKGRLSIYLRRWCARVFRDSSFRLRRRGNTLDSAIVFNLGDRCYGGGRERCVKIEGDDIHRVRALGAN